MFFFFFRPCSLSSFIPVPRSFRIYMCLYICVSWHMQSFPIRHNKSATKWIYHFLSLFHSIFRLTSFFFSLHYLACFILNPALLSFLFALFFIFVLIYLHLMAQILRCQPNIKIICWIEVMCEILSPLKIRWIWKHYECIKNK